MSTLLEMAEAVRLEEACQAKDVRTLPRTEDIYTKDRIKDLCELFETTPGFCCALESVGSDPKVIGQYLRSRDVAHFQNSEFAILI